MKESYKGAILFVVLIAFATSFILFNQNNDKNEEVVYNSHSTEIALITSKVDELREKSIFDSNLPINNETIKIPVHIDGEVNIPGVYNLEDGKIINDLIEIAGGLTDNADLTTINLAEKISAHTKIFIPKAGEQIAVEMTPIFVENMIPKNDRININMATSKEFEDLPGIGEVKAEAIINYRKEVGSFNNIQELTNISGIGDATLNGIKDLIMIE